MKNIFNLKVIAIALFFFAFIVPVTHAESTSLFFGIPPKQVQEGDRLTLDIKIQSPTRSINAVSGSLIFPESLVNVVSLSKEGSIINLWTKEPKVERNKIVFEGIILNPGFQGNAGTVFHVTFEARRFGTVMISFNEGAILANDGLGSNILATLGSTSFKIIPGQVFAQGGTTFENAEGRLVALPVIIDYSQTADSRGNIYVKGKGEPNAITKIAFKDISIKSVGERLIGMLQTKKKKLDEVLVHNNPQGGFEYVSSKNLLAGVYNATPFLVDNTNNTEKPGLGVQLLVSDSKVVKALVVVINVLGLLIPIVGLAMVIYFIPWYSLRRMRVIKKKLGLEEEQLELSGHQLEREDKVLDKKVEDIVHSEHS